MQQEQAARQQTQRRVLGAFSIGLGLVQITAGEKLARLLGLRNSARTRRLLTGLGIGEIATGMGLLGTSRGLAAAARKLDQPIHVLRSVTINCSPETVYQFWRDLENLPLFMAHLESVKVENGKSTWRAKAPAGTSIEWQAEVTLDRPNEAIAWRSLEDALVPNRGVARFKLAPGGRGTEVLVELKYEPPGGVVGAAVAKLLGEEPSRQIASDLRRLKQVLETGDVVCSDASIHEGLHAAQPASDEEQPVLLGRRET